MIPRLSGLWRSQTWWQLSAQSIGVLTASSWTAASMTTVHLLAGSSDQHLGDRSVLCRCKGSWSGRGSCHLLCGLVGVHEHLRHGRVTKFSKERVVEVTLDGRHGCRTWE